MSRIFQLCCAISATALAGFTAAPVRAADYAVLYSFGASNYDVRYPMAGLTRGSDGMFYGTSTGGGSNTSGTVFRISRQGSNCTVLHHFGAWIGDGLGPAGGVLEGSDGKLYGTTTYGGSNGFGTLYKINRDGTGYTIMRNFQGYPTDGYQPTSKLVEGTNGMLYGITEQGGSNYYGTAFKCDKNGSNYSILYHFSNTNGGTVRAGPGIMSDGAIYGTTISGGLMNNGVVYRLTMNSNYTVLHHFATNVGDGYGPQGRVIEASDGLLYGTTYSGGTAGYGTVFCIQKDGNGYRKLRNFTNAPDPRNPCATLWEGWDGMLYGVSYAGGTGVSPGNGTIFKMSRDGTNYSSVLKQFAGGTNDGHNPYDYEALVVGDDGALYGTTYSGGANNYGTMFRLAGPALPAIAARPGGSNCVRVTWSSPSVGFTLQQTASLTGATWTNCGAAWNDDGTNVACDVPITTNQLFLRLQRPLR